jgi:hypothetical protein
MNTHTQTLKEREDIRICTQLQTNAHTHTHTHTHIERERERENELMRER